MGGGDSLFRFGTRDGADARDEVDAAEGEAFVEDDEDDDTEIVVAARGFGDTGVIAPSSV